MNEKKLNMLEKLLGPGEDIRLEINYHMCKGGDIKDLILTALLICRMGARTSVKLESIGLFFRLQASALARSTEHVKFLRSCILEENRAVPQKKAAAVTASSTVSSSPPPPSMFVLALQLDTV